MLGRSRIPRVSRRRQQSRRALRAAAIETLETRRLLANSVWAWPGANGDLLYQPTAVGDRVEDFSNAGYRGGNAALPWATVRVTLNEAAADTADDTSRIQLAIDQVEAMPLDASGLRGAVLLTAGEYEISGTLNINASGVVLRGEGSGTVLRATGTSQRTLIEVQGGGSRSATSSTTKNITSDYVPVGARSFTIAGPHTFAAGDNVVIFRPSPQNWIEATGMHLIPDTDEDNPWTAGSRNISFERVVTRVDGNVITIDAPLTNSLDQQYGGGTISKYTWTGGTRIENVGVEYIDGISDYNAAEVDSSNRPIDDDHANQFVDFEDVQNGWMRFTNTKHFRQGAVKLEAGAKWITVEHCTDRLLVSVVTGGNRYPFNIDDGQQCLVRNCYSSQARHAWVVGAGNIPGPNVFVDDESNEAQYADDGPHQRWSVGGLYDNVRSENQINIRNRWDFGSGHGWSGANYVVWNAIAEDGFIVQNPPTAQNWLIGSSGSVIESNFGGPNPPGYYDQSGPGAAKVAVRSLYYWQLQQRFQHPLSAYRELWLGDIDRYTREAGTVDDPAVDASWKSAIQAIAGGAAVNGFDLVESNQYIPFTFDFALEPGRQVVGASLSLGIKSSGGTTSNDLVYLDSTGSSFTFAQLGSSAPGAADGARVLDLGNLLALLQDGKLNVAIQNDSTIDWAVLNIQTAPLAVSGLARNAEADAFVRSVSPTTNFGADPMLETLTGVRESLLRFDLSGVPSDALQIKLRLMPISGDGTVENTLSFVENDAWSEGGINWNNKPAAGATFASFFPVAGQAVEIDVTAWAREALNEGETKLTLRLASLGTSLVTYGSRNNSDANLQPKLLVVTPGVFITDIGDQLTAVSTPTPPIPFTIGDDQTPASSLIVSATSSNTALLPVANIVFGGSGNDRTVTLTPVAGMTGQSTVTITVSDGTGQTDSTTFLFRVAQMISGDQQSANQDDVFRIVRNGGVVDVYRNGVVVAQPPYVGGGPLVINGLGGNDTFQIDLLNGDPIPANGIQIEGGPGADVVTVIGTGGADAVAIGNEGVSVAGGAQVSFLGGVEDLALALGAGGDTIGGDGVISAFQNITLNVASGSVIPTGTFPAIIDVNVAAGATFNLAGVSQTIDQLTGLGSVTNATTSATLSVAGGSFGGAISNGSSTLGLTKVGAGTLTLSGANTHTGVTTISSGTIASGNAASLAGTSSFVMFNGGTFRVTANTQSINLANKYSTNHSFNGSGGTFEVDPGVVFTIGTPGGSASMRTAGGSFSGGGFTKTGQGILRIVSNNGQQDDPFVLEQGSIWLESASGLGGGDTGVRLDMKTGTSLVLKQDAPTNFLTPVRTPDASSGIAIGVDRLTAGPGVTHQLGALTSLGGLGLGVDVTSSNVTGGTATLQFPSVTLGGEALFATNNGSPDVTTRLILGPISGAGGVQKLGAGTLVYSGANTYTGATSLNNGTLQLAAAAALPGTALLMGGGVDAATLDMNGFSAAVSTLTVTGNNAIGSSVINLNAGQTLTVTGGAGGNAIFVGVIQNPVVDNVVTKLTVSGGGTLAVTNPAADILVDNDGNATTSANNATLDLAGLATFTADVDQLLVGVSLANNHRARGVLTLAANNIITANSIVLGRTNGNAAGGTQLNLGQANSIAANSITLATGKGNSAQMAFRAGLVNPSVTIIDKNTGVGADLMVGYKSNSGTASPVGTVDFTGGTINATLDGLVLGWQSDASGNTANGHFTMSAGDVSANSLTVGHAEDATSNANGTLNIAGGVFTLSGALMLARLTSGNASTGALNLTGGSVTFAAGITDAGGVSTLNLAGASLDLAGSAIGSAAAPINNLTFASGTLANVAQINGGAAPLNKTTAGTLVLAGVNSYTGATNVNAGTLLLESSLLTSSAVNVTAGLMKVAPDMSRVIRTPTVNITGTGRLDLTDNKLIVPGGDFAALSALVAQAYNFSAWDGDGILTSAADAQAGLTTLAIAPAEVVGYDGGAFGGVAVSAGDILVMYTYAGDLNLDGLIDASDYGIIDNWIQFPGTDAYFNGDFNFDGVIDASDYGIIDNGIQLQGPPIPT